MRDKNAVVLAMTFNIPQKHYVSDKDRVLVVKMPLVMLDALKAHGKALGWSYTALVDLILDQYFHSLEGRHKLPDHNPKYMDGARETVSLRLDMAAYEEMERWVKKSPLRPKISQLVFLALDTYLSQAKIQK